MNKQIILEQCDKIKNVVTEATQNEEEARSNAEKFKGIKEENTKLLDLLNKTKDIYWEMERILRIIEIDKEYDNTDNELENLKISVKDLIDKLRDNTSELEKYDSVKETVSFYNEALTDAVDFIGGEESAFKKDSVGVEEKEEDVPFSFDDNNDFNLDFDTDIFGSDDAESSDKEEEKVENTEDDRKEDTVEENKDDFASSFDFSSMYGFNDEDKEEDNHIDKQKVVDITDFTEDKNEEETSKEIEEEKKEEDEEDSSLSELNDLFNYLNNDDSFNN